MRLVAAMWTMTCLELAFPGVAHANAGIPFGFIAQPVAFIPLLAIAIAIAPFVIGGVVGLRRIALATAAEQAVPPEGPGLDQAGSDR